MRYPGIRGLAALEWFELDDAGQLRLVADVGPIADVHVHLALHFGPWGRVDLQSAPRPTEHYLPVERELELDVYINKNFSSEDLSRMKSDLVWGNFRRTGPRQTHTLPNLEREMDALGIRASVLLPIELPRISNNAERWLEAARGRPLMANLGSVHPFERGFRQRLEAQKAAGIRGVKIHPAVQLLPPDHPRAMAVYRACAELELPVLWHCGPVDIEPPLGRYFSRLKHYWKAVHENPETTFVLGHSGALEFDLAMELLARYPNVWVETSSQGLPNVRRLLDEAPADRIMFGSDWPFYHQAGPLAKVLIATENQPDQRKRVLWENAARLFELDSPPPQ